MHAPQELGVYPFKSFVSLQLGFLAAISVPFSELVVYCVVLVFGHVCLEACGSQSAWEQRERGSLLFPWLLPVLGGQVCTHSSCRDRASSILILFFVSLSPSLIICSQNHLDLEHERFPTLGQEPHFTDHAGQTLPGYIHLYINTVISTIFYAGRSSWR